MKYFKKGIISILALSLITINIPTTTTNIVKAEETQTTDNTTSYTVYFDTDGGSSCTDVTISYNEEFELPTPTKLGYTFTGWYSDKNYNTYLGNGGDKIKNLTDINGKSIIIYAKWTANSYNITWNTNGGLFSDNTTTLTTTIKYMSNIQCPTDPIYEGYKFNGWYDTNSNKIRNKTTYKVTDNSTYTAQWTPITYTINFYSNGGAGKMESMTLSYGETKTLTLNSFTKSNYNFIGWSITSNGKVAYTDGMAVSNLTITDGNLINLYAIWELSPTTPTSSPTNTNNPTTTNSPTNTNNPTITNKPNTTNKPTNITTKPSVTSTAKPTATPQHYTSGEISVHDVYACQKISTNSAILLKVTNKNQTSYKVDNTIDINGTKCKITDIGDSVFKGCKKAKKITIGKNVVNIGKKAFYNCTNLKKVIIKSKKLKKIGKKAFNGSKYTIKFKVPKKCKSSYKKLLKKSKLNKFKI